MSERKECPLLFLDVDGPLLPFGDGPQREPSGTASDSHLARLDPQVGPRLAALPCELVWATTWEGVDDEITDADRDWASTHHPASALLHRIASSRGLTDEDFAVLDQWLRAA